MIRRTPQLHSNEKSVSPRGSSYHLTIVVPFLTIARLRMVYIFFAKFVVGETVQLQVERSKQSTDIVLQLGYIYMVLFTTTSADISFNIRVKYVEIVLGQDVSTSESVDSELQGGAGQGVSEIEQLEVGLGEQLGMAIQLTSVVLSAFIISVVKYEYLTNSQICSAVVLTRPIGSGSSV
jgi:hypothetical protein